MNPSLRPWVALAAAVFVLAIVPAAAQASPETLKRSVENITQAPLDVALAPVVAGMTLVRNLREIDDSIGVRIAYPIPGYIWLTAVQLGAATIRGITGVIELVPGLGLVFFEADMDPLFDPADENEALVDVETPVYHIRFGIDYTTPAY